MVVHGGLLFRRVDQRRKGQKELFIPVAALVRRIEMAAQIQRLNHLNAPDRLVQNLRRDLAAALAVNGKALVMLRIEIQHALHAFPRLLIPHQGADCHRLQTGRYLQPVKIDPRFIIALTHDHPAAVGAYKLIGRMKGHFAVRRQLGGAVRAGKVMRPAGYPVGLIAECVAQFLAFFCSFGHDRGVIRLVGTNQLLDFFGSRVHQSTLLWNFE